MKSPIEYYFDESFRKRVPVNEHGLPVIDWGETIPGSKREKTLYIKNMTHDKLVLRQPYTNDEDLHITNFPSRLFGNGTGAVQLLFAPNMERVEPHNTDWGFDVVIG